MVQTVRSACPNLLLRSMSEADFALLAPALSRVSVSVDTVLAAPGAAIEAAYFPCGGIITVSKVSEGGARIGLGHIGYEGLAGWPVLLGTELATHETRMTAVGGTALRIETPDLLAACRASETLTGLLLRYVRSFTIQLSNTIVSSLMHSVDTRLCRWTLMAHDRIEGDELEVMHHEIAVMLAVRRASVTDALHKMEGDGLIRARRGRVIIRDRSGLRQRVGDTYGAAEAEYSRLIAPFSKCARETL